MTSTAEQVGRVVGGRYRLLAPVGTGASSQVYAASDTRLSRRVAVKVLHPMLAGDQAFLRRFRAEARLAASLDHPNVMRVFDWGEEAEGPYLVLEYLGGGSLRALLDTGVRMSHSQVASIGAQAAAGLAYAHRRGIVHRDIKPSNLLFDEEGRLRIADFGVARALAESALTEPLGAIFGTARYASPEQAEGRPVDDRTDVYSLTLVLYEALVGRVPFTGDTITSLLMARVGATLPWAAELGPMAPILAQAAISEPLARLDAAALESDLDMLVRELPPPAALPLVPALSSAALSWADRDPTVTEPGVARTQPVGPPEGPPALAVPVVRGALGVRGEPGVAEVPAVPDAWPEDITLSTVPAGAGGGVSAAAETAELADLATTVALAGAAPAAGPAATQALPLAAPAPAPAAGPPRKRRRRYRWVAWVLVVLLLAGAAGTASALFVRHQAYEHVVPTLTSMTLADAERTASDVGLVAKQTGTAWSTTVPSGHVISQSIKPGRHELRHTVIDLTVSRGTEPVAVPSLSGDTLAEADAALARAHLHAGSKPTYLYNSTVPSGKVISWTEDGKSVPPGTAIDLTFSKGHAPVAVPVIPTTDSLGAAEATLADLGFRTVEGAPEYSTSVQAGDVLQVSPSAASGPQPYGSTVTIVLSKGPQYVVVPQGLVGHSLSFAKRALAALGLEWHVVGIGDTVAGLRPRAGTTVQVGTVVTISVSPF